MISALLLAVLAQTAPPPPPPAAEPLIPHAFYEEVLSWDLQANRAVRGRQRTVLTRTEFFEQVGRLDLIDKSTSLKARRIGLGIGAGAVLLGGVIAGIVVLTRSPDVNSAFCVSRIDNYQQCQATERVHQTGSAFLFAGSLATAALLATLAWWSNPDVLSGDEAIQLAARYNAGLLKRVRAGGSSLKWLPVICADGAQLAVTGRF